MSKIPKWVNKPVWVKILFSTYRNELFSLKRAFANSKEVKAFVAERWVKGLNITVQYLAPATRTDLQPKIPVDLRDLSGPSLTRIDKNPEPFEFPFGIGCYLVMK